MKTRIKVIIKKPSQLVSTTIQGQGNGELATSIKKFRAKVQVYDAKAARFNKLAALLF